MHYTQSEFDSNEEYKFFTRNTEKLSPAQSYLYPNSFEDSEGCTFWAKPDFIYQDTIYVEFKCYKLNNKKTQDHADESWSKQRHWITRKNRQQKLLENHWSNSVFKQGIVARHYQGRFLLVFKDNTKLSTQAVNKMKAEKIPWCYESEMLNNLEEMLSRLTIH
ncbi:hypothetical protein [Nitrincola sp.]|uniref:hypothetical protein n=1 Tax=Nitrincola sp. TaxID=1926584 RepID=UPI003A8F3B98